MYETIERAARARRSRDGADGIKVDRAAPAELSWDFEWRIAEIEQTRGGEVDGVKMRPPPDSTFRTFAQKTGWAGSVDVVPRKRRFR